MCQGLVEMAEMDRGHSQAVMARRHGRRQVYGTLICDAGLLVALLLGVDVALEQVQVRVVGVLPQEGLQALVDGFQMPGGVEPGFIKPELRRRPPRPPCRQRLLVRPLGPPAQVLLGHVQQVQAGLLVMGAYGQPTLREFFFGSVTRTLLAESPVPLFLYH